MFSPLTNTSIQVCREWEGTALKVNKDVRLALIRIGVVLGKDGGALGITYLLILFSLSFLEKNGSKFSYAYVLINLVRFIRLNNNIIRR